MIQSSPEQPLFVLFQYKTEFRLNERCFTAVRRNCVSSQRYCNCLLISKRRLHYANAASDDWHPKYYQTTDYALRLSVMADIATMRMKALHFWDKHGISAASEAFGVSCRTLYWWRQLLNKGGPEGLIPHSKAPLVRRKKHWHPDVLKEIRRLRTELPNLCQRHDV